MTDDGPTVTTEFFNTASDTMEEGPELLLALYGHCVVTLPEEDLKTSLIIGGYSGRIDENRGYSSDTWQYSWNSSLLHISQLHSLNEPRMHHACGTLRKKESDHEHEFMIIVAGGFNGLNSLNTVEMFDYSGELKFYEKWEKLTASSLPIALHGGLFLSTARCTELALVGGFSSELSSILNDVLTTDGDVATTGWKENDGQLLSRRSDFVAIPGSSDVLTCE
jgi:hypothetical protein